MDEKTNIEELASLVILNYQNRFKNQHIADEASKARELVDDDPETAWKLILILIEKADTDRLLAYIAAGVLEDLVRGHFEAFIDRIEEKARQWPKFRRALTGVWFGTDLSKVQIDKIVKYTSTVKDPL